ncbi:MAG: helix-turn-helix domain-containing protein [Chloroflexota bacterium]
MTKLPSGRASGTVRNDLAGSQNYEPERVTGQTEPPPGVAIQAARAARPDALSVAWIAAHLKLTPATIRRYLRTGRLKGQLGSSAAGGRRYRVTRAELERFILSMRA